jgi:hypothetical protein
VHVRIVGVVVTDRRPPQVASEVLLHPLDQVARVLPQVQLMTVLGRNDESKLSLLARDGLGKFLTLNVSVAPE